jgi:hypothetical protein
VDGPLNETCRTIDSHELADTTSEGNACSPATNEKSALLTTPRREGEEEPNVESTPQRLLRPKVLAPLLTTPVSSGIVASEDIPKNASPKKIKNSEDARELKTSSPKDASRGENEFIPCTMLPTSPRNARSHKSSSLEGNEMTQADAEDDHAEEILPEEAMRDKALPPMVATPKSPCALDSCQDRLFSPEAERQTQADDDHAEVSAFALQAPKEESAPNATSESLQPGKHEQIEYGNHMFEAKAEVEVERGLESCLVGDMHEQEPQENMQVKSSTEEKQLSVHEHSPNSELDDIPSPLAVVEDRSEVVSKVPPCPKSLKELPFISPVVSESQPVSTDPAQTCHEVTPCENELELSMTLDGSEKQHGSSSKMANTLQSALSGTLPKKKSSVRFSEEAAEIVEVVRVEQSCWETDALDDEEAVLASVEDDASDWDSDEEEPVTFSGKGHDANAHMDLQPSSAAHQPGVKDALITEDTEDWDTDEEEPVTLNADPVEPSGWDSDEDEFQTSPQENRNEDPAVVTLEEDRQSSKGSSATHIDEVDDLVGMVLAADTSVSLTPPFRGSEKYGFVPGLHCTGCDFQVMRIENYTWNKTVNYMFFRNNYPNVMRLRKGLSPQDNSAALCCQCSWRSSDLSAPMAAESGGLRWKFISA